MPFTTTKTVLYLTPSTRLLGARRSLLSLAVNLDREGWNPVVCGQDRGDLDTALKEVNIPYDVVKTGWWRKGKYFLWRPFAISRLAELIRRFNVDLVHCNEIYPNPYAVRAAVQAGNKLGRPIPVVTHMRLSVTPRMIRNYNLEKADLILVPSDAASQDFNVWPDKYESVKVVPNGVDLTEFRRTRSRSEARRQIGVPPEGPLLAAIGQVSPRKGGDVVVKALKRIVTEFPDVKLMFVGNPHRGQEAFADQLRAFVASSADLKDRVFFFPYTMQILPYYEACDVNLLISREESFGRTIIEAGALGVPSVGARVGGIPELIADGQTGMLIEAENDVQLADALRRLLADENLRNTLGESAFRHAAQNFSITSHAVRIMDLYDQVLSYRLTNG